MNQVILFIYLLISKNITKEDIKGYFLPYCKTIFFENPYPSWRILCFFRG